MVAASSHAGRHAAVCRLGGVAAPAGRFRRHAGILPAARPRRRPACLRQCGPAFRTGGVMQPHWWPMACLPRCSPSRRRRCVCHRAGLSVPQQEKSARLTACCCVSRAPRRCPAARAKMHGLGGGAVVTAVRRPVSLQLPRCIPPRSRRRLCRPRPACCRRRRIRP